MRVLAWIVCGLSVLGAVNGAQAAPGDLDTGFSGDGTIVEAGLAPSSVSAMALQPDGKIVAVAGVGGDFAVVRYHRNGTRDTTFGTGGLVLTAFGGPLSVDAPTAVVIQGDGKIVVAGRVGSQSAPQVGIARYHPNGALDTTFSGDGRFTMQFSSGGGGARAVAIQASGRIVVVGSTGPDFALARVNANGTFDATFGTPFFVGGIATRNFGGATESASAVTLLSDGRILVAGTAQFEGRNVFAFDIFTTDGVPTFVGGGVGNSAQHAAFGGASVAARADAAAVQADGRIVLVGEITVTTGGGQVPLVFDRGMAIARYNTNGTMDATFGSDGLRTVDFGSNSSASAVAIQPDGKIVVVGRVDRTQGTPSNIDFAVVRLNGNGSFDLSFSGDGRLTTDFAGVNDFGSAVAVQKSDGRIVVAGSAGGTIALARYHAFTCNGANVTILGTNGPDTINGTEKADVIHGLGGNDTIRGGGGDDIICGGDGDDTLFGGPGNDTLVAGLGRDVLNGGSFGVISPQGTDICLGSNLGAVSDPVDTFVNCATVNTGTAGVSGEWLAIEQQCNRSPRVPQCRLHGEIRVFNPGLETTAVPSTVAFFLSEDDVLDEGDSFLTTESVRAMEAGEDEVIKLNVKLVDGADVSGLHVIAVVDFFDDVPERNEGNNLAVSPVIFTLRDRAGR